MDSGEVQQAIDIARESILIAIKMSAVPLIVGLAIGLLVSIVQTLTQIQEQTLALIPKMLAVVLSIFLILPWLIGQITDYTVLVFTDMITWFR